MGFIFKLVINLMILGFGTAGGCFDELNISLIYSVRLGMRIDTKG